VFLMVNHAWSASSFSRSVKSHVEPYVYNSFAWLLTMICVVIAWVFFKAGSFEGAIVMLHAMSGFTSLSNVEHWTDIVPLADSVLYILCMMTLIVIVLPNSIDLTQNYNPALHVRQELKANAKSLWSLVWTPNLRWAAVISCMAFASVIQIYRLNDLTEFIYFNF